MSSASPVHPAFRVSTKLWLAFGVLMALFAGSGIVSHQAIQRIGGDVFRLVEVKEPLEDSVLEMEINAGKTARAVFDYVRESEPEHLVAMRDSAADFARFAAEFDRLAETDEERRLGREAARMYAELNALGWEIVELAGSRQALVRRFHADALEIDELIDEKLQPAIDRTAPDPMTRMEAVLEMEINIHEAFAAIEGYILHRDPALRRIAADAEEDFGRFAAQYRAAGLSGPEAAALDRIDRDFADAVGAGDQVMALTDRLVGRLDELGERLKAMDAILDKELHSLTHAGTAQAARNARTSSERAAVLLLVLGAIALAVGLVSAWALSRGILGSIGELARGAEIVGAGRMSHRIEIRSRDEFGYLAAAFNRMVENLARARQSIEDARARLAEKVDERTADLRRELARRVQAQEALKESEARFRDFAESTSDWFWEMDEDLRFTHFSGRFSEITGYEPAELIAEKRQELTAENTDDPRWQEHFADLEARRPFQNFCYPLKRSDGVTIQVSVSGKPVFAGDGTFRGYRGTSTDISERVAAEDDARRHERELAQVLRRSTLGEMAATIAHELNQPLAAVTNYARGCLRGIRSEKWRFGEVRDALEQLCTEAERAHAIIHDIGTFLGKSEPMKAPSDVNAIIHSVVRIAEGELRGDGVKLRLDLAPGLPLAPMDEVGVQQVVLNLVRNGIEAMRESDAATRELLVQTSLDATGTVEVAVGDTGPGISAGAEAQIFKPFFTTKAKGIGMGLPISKRIVRAHAGRLWTSRNPDGGMTCHFTIPANGEEHDAAA